VDCLRQRLANFSLLYAVHDLAAVLFLLLLIAHIYLEVVVNPEKVRSIFGRYIWPSWLEEHNPDA
jgi:thiosulfate reductase cytochrome b subunit